MKQTDAITVAADPGDTETIPAGVSDTWGEVVLGDLDFNNGLPEYLVIHGTLHDTSAVVSIADDDGGGNGFSSFGGVTVSGPGATWDTSGDIYLGQDYYAGSVTLTVADQGSATWANLYLGGILAVDDTARIAGAITSLAGGLEAIAKPGGGASQTVTISNAIILSEGGNEDESDFGTGLEAAAGTRLVIEGTISGSGDDNSLTINGNVTLAHADNSFSGGTSINSGRLELAGSGAAGTGEIEFYSYDNTTQAGLTLAIDPAAVATGALSNMLGGFVKGDTIDMTDASVTSVKVNSDNQLLIDEGGRTVTLSFTERDNLTNAKFKLSSDEHGGTDITLVQVSSRDLYWARPVDGGFEQAGDWLSGGKPTTAVPGVGNVAIFDTRGATPYTVSGDGSAAEIKVVGDQVTFTGNLTLDGQYDTAIDFGNDLIDLGVDGGGHATVAAGASITGTQIIAIAEAYDNATGSLTIEGTVTERAIDVGSLGTLTIQGPHAVVDVFLDANFDSTIIIKDGGQLQASGSQIFGAVTVTGAGSTWIRPDGGSGDAASDSTLGAVTVENGGAVRGGNIRVDSGPIVITGTGSIWQSTWLSFAGYGQGSPVHRITITDHATLSSPNAVAIGTWLLALDATATLSIGGLSFQGGILDALDEIGQSRSPGVVVDVSIVLDGHVKFESQAGTSLTLDGLITGDDTGTALVVSAGKVALGHADNSYGGTILAGGTLVLEAAGAAGTGAIEFLKGASSRLDIATGAVSTNDIQHFVAGDAIQLLDTTEKSFDFEENTAHTGGTLVVTLKDGSSDSLTFDGDYTKADFTVQSDMVDGAAATEITTDEPPCFLAGTHILTTRGEIAVEHLAVGDIVLTAAGRAAPVRWIGSSRFDLTRLRAPAHFRPIRIRQSAIGQGLPKRDLLVSRGHGIFLQDVLIPALYLLNGATIAEDRGFDAVTYFHVELDRHDILLAEGVAAESYLDTGNRHLFEDGVTLDPIPGKTAGCAPVVQAGDALLRARAALQARIPRASYHATRDPDLHLDMDGVALRPSRRNGRTYRFTVDRAPRRLRMMSRANVSDRIGETPDMRMFGVATRRIALHAPGLTRAIDLADPELGPGFSWVERAADGDVFRWTDGAAALPASLWQDVDAFELEIEVGNAVSYWTGASVPWGAT